MKDKPLVRGLAYAMRLELQHAYAAKTEALAKQRFEKWFRWVQEESGEMKSALLEPMRKVANMVEEHLKGILGHWKERLSKAFLEGLNSLFSAVKRKGRGYRSIKYMRTMLYFVAGKLEIPYYA